MNDARQRDTLTDASERRLRQKAKPPKDASEPQTRNDYRLGAPRLLGRTRLCPLSFRAPPVPSQRPGSQRTIGARGRRGVTQDGPPPACRTAYSNDTTGSRQLCLCGSLNSFELSMQWSYKGTADGNEIRKAMIRGQQKTERCGAEGA